MPIDMQRGPRLSYSTWKLWAIHGYMATPPIRSQSVTGGSNNLVGSARHTLAAKPSSFCCVERRSHDFSGQLVVDDASHCASFRHRAGLATVGSLGLQGFPCRLFFWGTDLKEGDGGEMWKEHFGWSKHLWAFLLHDCHTFIYFPDCSHQICEGAPWLERPIMRRRLNALYSHVAWETLMWLHKSKRIRSSTRKVEAGYSRRSNEKYSFHLISAYWLRWSSCIGRIDACRGAWGADLRPTSFGHWQSSGTNQARAELKWAEIRLKHYPLHWRFLRLH